MKDALIVLKVGKTVNLKLVFCNQEPLVPGTSVNGSGQETINNTLSSDDC